jgi:dTDP-4-dehydrorhamnose reductase
MVRKAISSTETVSVVADQIGQPTSAEELAKQILKVSQARITNCILHATNSGETSWYEFARKLFSLCGEPESRLKPVTSNEFPTPAKRPNYSVLDHSNWAEFGLTPMRPWGDALCAVFPKIKSSVERELADE